MSFIFYPLLIGNDWRQLVTTEFTTMIGGTMGFFDWMCTVLAIGHEVRKGRTYGRTSYRNVTSSVTKRQQIVGDKVITLFTTTASNGNRTITRRQVVRNGKIVTLVTEKYKG